VSAVDPPRDRVRAIFLGSGTFGIGALRRLAQQPLVELVGVVTAPPRPIGRRRTVTPTPIETLMRCLSCTHADFQLTRGV